MDFWSQIEKGKGERAKPIDKSGSEASKEKGPESTILEEDSSTSSARKDKQTDEAEKPVDEDTNLDQRKKAGEPGIAADQNPSFLRQRMLTSLRKPQTRTPRLLPIRTRRFSSSMSPRDIRTKSPSQRKVNKYDVSDEKDAERMRRST